MPQIRNMLRVTLPRETKRAVICTAIKQLRTLEFYYHGGFRTVEPYALGIVLKGDADNESLICYQTEGFSELREVVGWKIYRIGEMDDLQILNEKLTGDRPGYDPDTLEMRQVICCVRLAKKPALELPVLAPVPEVKKEPVVRYFTHNELMERFRSAHATPVSELDTAIWPDPLEMPFPERIKAASLPISVLGFKPKYLVGHWNNHR